MIAAINLGPLKDGESWDDLLTITLDRRMWSIALAAITQMGQNVCEGIEDLGKRAAEGDVLAMLTVVALHESNDDLRELSLGIVQVLNPAMYEQVKEHARKHADA